MKPVNKKASSIPVSSECIVWQGDNIPCLDIYKGDALSIITYTLAEQLCKISELGDLSSINIDKVVKLCNNGNVDKTLLSILQLMVDNNICFKDTIDQILIRVGLLEAGSPFLLNTSCLGKNINTVEKTLQQLIINICNYRTSVDNINTQLDSLQLQIDDVEDAESIENSIDTCLALNRFVSEQTILTALEACQINIDIGTWEYPISLLGDLNVYYSVGIPVVDGCRSTYPNGWIVSTCDYTIAEIVNNLAIAIYGQEDRITTVEEDCCTSKCEDIQLGFSVITNEEQTAVILRFRDVDGTKIPSDFTDCGTKVVITDVNGDKETFIIELANELITEDLDVSSLFLEEPVNISILSTLCSDSYTCTQCLGVDYDLKVDGCPVCLIETEGSGNITIIYELP